MSVSWLGFSCNAKFEVISFPCSIPPRNFSKNADETPKPIFQTIKSTAMQCFCNVYGYLVPTGRDYLALTESLRVKAYDLPSVCGKASKCDIVIWHAG